MTEQKLVQYTEGSPWFWKIFGGAIMGLISVLLIGYISNIGNNFDRSLIDLRGDVKEMRQQLDTQRERLAVLEQGSYKDKITTLETRAAALEAALDVQKQKVAACEASNAALKDELKSLRDWNKETSRQLQELREKYAADSAKKKTQ